MGYSTTFDSTPEQRETAYAAYFRRRPTSAVWGTACLVVGIVFMWLDGAGFIEGVAIAAGIIGILGAGSARRLAKRRSHERGNLRTSLTVDEKGLTVEMPLISTRISWDYIEDLRRSAELWILIYGRGIGHLPIPTEAMSQEMRDFIERSIAESKRRRAEKGA